MCNAVKVRHRAKQIIKAVCQLLSGGSGVCLGVAGFRLHGRQPNGRNVNRLSSMGVDPYE